MLKLGARVRNPKEAEACLDKGFSYYEITLPSPGGRSEIETYQELTRQNNLALMGHGPQEGDPFDVERMAAIYLPQLDQAVDEALLLNIPALTVHCWLESRVLPQDVIARKIELLAQIAATSAAKGVLIMVENLSETHKDMQKALDHSPDLGLTLDVGHAMLMQPDNQAPLIITHLFDRITHLHLHDNHGGNSPRDDLHLVPGTGRVPFAEIFGLLQERGYDKTATLELRPPEIGAARDWVLDQWARAHKPKGS